MIKHSRSRLFVTHHLCDRADEISSGMEDVVKYSEIISKGEEFNIYKAFGYELLGSNVTEGEAYLAGKRRHEEILKQKEEEKRRAEQERVRLLNMQCANDKKEKYIKQANRCPAVVRLLTSFYVFLLLLVLGIVAVLKIRSLICDNIGELYNLICNNIFLIALFLIPTIIIYVGYKIEAKK